MSSITPADHARLLEVWESAVRATHHFLSEADIQKFLPLVQQVLTDASIIYCLRNVDGRAFAFLGVEADAIDMLFVHADYRGRGAGRALVEFAMRELGARRVDVNEQNPSGVGFYQHLGFRRVGRSPLNGMGHPFPILHLVLV